MRRVLRVAIVMLGLQLSLSQVAEVGGGGLGIIVSTLASTILFTLWLDRQRANGRDPMGTRVDGTQAPLPASRAVSGAGADVLAEECREVLLVSRAAPAAR